ncbi:MAG TPA: hypothetical protein PKB11_14610 [Desulfovibrio sp.]|uniref:hypothetical protein n=1 Tax=Desulfovibrio sp. TaxID=885 RepID=UPI002C09C03B|nr:hypothetical protein [Desulfovibrio sp.]HMM39986.1 hypothetical protein [Desulfovibrio sp.]
MQIERSSIPITIVKTDDFSDVYNSISKIKRKIPARLLRHFKEQLFELIQNNDPNDRLAVLNLEEIEDRDDIEFIVGLGIKSEFVDKGYSGIEAIDVFKDVVFGENRLRSKRLLQKTLPQLLKKSPFIHVFKYLHSSGIHNNEEYIASGYALKKSVDLSIERYQSKPYKSYYKNNADGMNTSQIIQSYEPQKAVTLIPFVSPKNIDLDEVRAFLKVHFDNIDHSKSTYATYFRKLACLYDRLMYGWFL